MTAIQIKFSQKAARVLRRKAIENAKSISDMAKEVVIV